MKSIPPDKQEYKNDIAMALGGRAAEEIIFGDVTSGAYSDIQSATTTAKRMVTLFGMSEKLGPRRFGSDQNEVFLGRDFSSNADYSEAIAAVIDDEIHAIIDEAYVRAKSLLEANIDKLHFIADYLLAHEDMDGEQFKTVMENDNVTVEMIEAIAAEREKASREANEARKAAEESRSQLGKALEDTDMVFITAGMGGGTGTGAAPVVARVAHEMGVLTVGIVTKPFGFEGRRRMDQAVAGIAELSQYVDSLVVIPNDRLKQVSDSRITLENAFEIADGVLSRGTKSISELITAPGLINLDFADVSSVMKNAGYAHMGVGSASGKDKAEQAARQAISSPLLESSISGSHGVLISITVSPDVGLEDVDLASSMIAAEASPEANVIWGVNIDRELEDEMRITIIATGFANSNKPEEGKPVKKEEKPVEPAPQPRPQPRPHRERPARPDGAAPVRRERPSRASADEELDRLMKEFDTPRKKSR